ncbi:chemotaxis protein CheW [Methylobacterium nodulans]|uniref:CheW protein n=1 Tax=Methylobacterium nodulans (strain LMG 21967 / CNCM I-2342 / ORS 2060) TaxID=460265 RepID=B8IMV2_METNO|nr:chemotaxis protein CheW [Methylobacterium nodulans]ACL60295.1 CheW protein [Methylobacterium nodulans ORS 2060]
MTGSSPRPAGPVRPDAESALGAARIEALLDARSRALAERGRAPAETRARRRVLLCRLGPERFGLPLGAVAEVAPYRACTPVPGAPPALLGLSGRGGALLSVIDLATVLNLPAPASDGPAHLVVLRRESPRIGLRVERALAVLDALVEDSPAPPGRPISGHARAGAEDAEGFALLDLQALLQPFLGAAPRA